MAGEDTHWSSDVPVSMPIPTDAERVIGMQGFAFTANGLAADISPVEYERLSTPDWAPLVRPTETVYEDVDLDAPPSSMESF